MHGDAATSLTWQCLDPRPADMAGCRATDLAPCRTAWQAQVRGVARPSLPLLSPLYLFHLFRPVAPAPVTAAVTLARRIPPSSTSPWPPPLPSAPPHRPALPILLCSGSAHFPVPPLVGQPFDHGLRRQGRQRPSPSSGLTPRWSSGAAKVFPLLKYSHFVD